MEGTLIHPGVVEEEEEMVTGEEVALIGEEEEMGVAITGEEEAEMGVAITGEEEAEMGVAITGEEEEVAIIGEEEQVLVGEIAVDLGEEQVGVAIGAVGRETIAVLVIGQVVVAVIPVNGEEEEPIPGNARGALVGIVEWTIGQQMLVQ